MQHLAPLPFAQFAPAVAPQSPLRVAITEAYRRPEPECVAALLDAATLPPATAAAARRTAGTLIRGLRAETPSAGVAALVQEFALSSQEGVALMCLAEALLRIPDTATRDALIRDKIAQGDWQAHLGGARSLFVNAATWGLVVTGKLVDSVNDAGLAAALTRLLARAGEPAIRRGVDYAMRLMGEQFVIGETIDEALKRARRMEARGFAYSFDMLGEAATTAADAERYFKDYEIAVHAIGSASARRGIFEGPGISIKLSALHPRYSRAQAGRVMAEMLPRVKALALIARGYDIGFNIDAEEADRLELSLDILESLARDPDLAGWDGLGFVIQAYGKRCPFVIDWLVDLARSSGRRLMVRLVKGAYWDAEIKRAQVDGLKGFPVYTRKVHTDVAYIACARKLLAAPDAVFPQFATHNAQTLATIYEMAGPEFTQGRYEFQCLHGMGEALYEQVVGPDRLNRPCRIYAPVGTHETLLAYLVRRLLENGANSSFVNRIADPAVAIEDLVADPVEVVRAMSVPGSPHPAIALPRDIYTERANSAGIDLTDENSLTQLQATLAQTSTGPWGAAPVLAGAPIDRPWTDVVDPADHRMIVGQVAWSTAQDAAAAVRSALAASPSWAATSGEGRAQCLERAANTLQERMPLLLGLIVREAGKSLPDAIAEVREAIDFLRYYACRARELEHGLRPLGPIVCISPWNFPLAIFTGQVAAALAAGNTVLAKPAEETPLIAAESVRILHEAGIPREVLQFLPGDGAVGAALLEAPQTAGVMFTGSTEVARLIQRQLATRLSNEGRPIPLIAETGGQNAMIVDSSALAEQVVADVIASAFGSAGQRCSALRVLCLQEEIADRTLAMLKGAMAELRVGRTDNLAVDIGPVITAEAKRTIDGHIEHMRATNHRVEQVALPPETGHGTFVAPTIIELHHIDELKREIFGPVLHVVRYRRRDLDALMAAINATGYALTFGLHTRLDATIREVTARVDAGNIYVNRNMIGAVVGVQPFGGNGLSGTGPKAGGPLYLTRLVQQAAMPVLPRDGTRDDPDAAVLDLADWLARSGDGPGAQRTREIARTTPLGYAVQLPGPVGERNVYSLRARGTVLLRPASLDGLLHQLAVALAAGNKVVVETHAAVAAVLDGLPASVHARFGNADAPLAGVLVEGDADALLATLHEMAQRPGVIVNVQGATSETLAQGGAYCSSWLLEETSTSINTTAAGGNASLMALA